MFSIVGRSSGLRDQQRSMRLHNSSETRFLGAGPSGRGGHCFLPSLTWMTAASRVSSGNGTFSVMHSRISIANEYVSESFVPGMLFFSMSSGAEYLTVSPDTVFEVVLSLLSSTIFAIPKSQIRGSPLPIYGQPAVHQMWARNLPVERPARFSTRLQPMDFHEGGLKNLRI